MEARRSLRSLFVQKVANALLSLLILWLLWLLYINSFLPTSSLTLFSVVTLTSRSVVFFSAVIVFSTNVFQLINDGLHFATKLFSFSGAKKNVSSTTSAIVAEKPLTSAAVESSIPSAVLAQSKSLNAISPMPKTRPSRNSLDTSSSSSSSSSMHQSGLSSFNPEDSSLFGKASRVQQQEKQHEFQFSSSAIGGGGEGGGVANRRDFKQNSSRPFDTPSAASRVGLTFGANATGVQPTPMSSLRRRRGSNSAMMDISMTPSFSVAKAPRLPLPREGGRGVFGATDVFDLNNSSGLVIAPGGVDDSGVHKSGWNRGGGGSVSARDLGLDRASLASTMWDSNESRLRERISTAQENELRYKKTDTAQSQHLMHQQQQQQQRGNRTDPVLLFDVFGGEVHDTGQGFGAWRTSRPPVGTGNGGFPSISSRTSNSGLREEHEYLDGFTTTSTSSASSFPQDSQQRFNARGGSSVGSSRYSHAEHSSASDLRFEVKAAELPRRAYFHGLGASNEAQIGGSASPTSPGFEYSKDLSSSSSSTQLQH